MKWPTLLGIDSNAHSEMWGSEKANQRGETLEEWITQNRISILNKGKKPTFHTIRASSIIDITLCTSNFDEYVQKWQVEEGFQLSDHRLISFSLKLSIDKPNLRRPVTKTNWEDFKEELNNTKWDPPLTWNQDTIDKATQQLEHDILRAFNKACPMREIKPRKTHLKWWTQDLTNLRKEVRILGQKARRSNDSVSWELYRGKRNQYKYMIRRAKLDSWNNYLAKAESTKELSIINKIIYKNENRKLGLLKNPQGHCSGNPLDSIKLLLENHFPGSIANMTEKEMYKVEISNRDLHKFKDLDFVNEVTIESIIRKFGQFKAAGPDGFMPIVLRNLPNKIIQRLILIYKAIIITNYVPYSWRESKVIFIPKPGRVTYDEPKAFRPISLTNFTFKTLEKIILGQLEKNYFSTNPLHKAQHAFRRNKSTDTAIGEVIDFIEGAILRNNVTLGVFLDIQGAFDNLNISNTIEQLNKKQLPHYFLGWYSHYLKNRRITTELMGTTVNRYLTRGTPQGGVLSPVLWNLNFDSLLELFDKGPIKAVGFADDCCLLISDTDPNTCRALMQSAIYKVTNWGVKNGLNFNPSKTVAILFTTKRRVPQIRNLTMNNVDIEYSKYVKYLGITLDSKLSWKKHINNTVNKAKMHLVTFNKALNKINNFSPLSSKLIYNTFIKTALTYGSYAWGHAIHKKHINNQLNKVNRLALLLITPVRRSTPTAALEIILGIKPLDLEITKTGISTHARIKDRITTTWDGNGYTKSSTRNKWETQLKLAWETGKGISTNRPFKDVISDISDNLTNRRWDERWRDLTTCRQTKVWYPEVRTTLDKSMEIIKLSRDNIKLYTEVITGHNNLMYHKSKTIPGTSAKCRLCEDEDETFIHLALNCPRLNSIRAQIFMNYVIQPDPTFPWTPKQILSFTREALVRNLLRFEE